MSGLVQVLTLSSATALGPMAAVAVWNLLTAPRLHRLPPAGGGALISVLVPARDEADNLRALIPALLASRYPALEILVLDDGSRDSTPDVVRRFAEADRRLHLVAGGEPPRGWAGKNWACHQLSRRARGDLLLFCDADVVPEPDAVGRTVTALERAGAVTAFPRHQTGDWFEQAVVPVVTKLPIAALLPLTLVRATRTRSLAAGNGQWFAWRRDAYHAAGGHAAVRSSVLDDVGLARRAKAAGVSLSATVATRDLRIRMYRSRRSVRDGFAKNLYPLVGGRPWTLVAALLLFALTMLVPLALPLLGAGAALVLLPLALLVAVRAASGLLFRETLAEMLLHPVGAAAAIGLAVTSWWRYHQGTVSWKRRPLVTLTRP